jgi:hypothetical protein
VGEVNRWLDDLVGPDDDRAIRFRELHDQLLGDGTQ